MSDTTLRLKLKKLPPAVMRLSVSTLTQKLIKFVNAHRHKILSTIISQLTLFNNFIIPSSMRGTVGHSTTAPQKKPNFISTYKSLRMGNTSAQTQGQAVLARDPWVSSYNIMLLGKTLYRTMSVFI